MANKLVRTLYVGLGGTGTKAIIQTKRYFAETYGKDKIPPVVAFLAIDTDSGVPNDDPVVKLEQDEIVNISVDDAAAYYRRNTDAFTWLPDVNVKVVRRMTTGAGQVRTNGRFAATINYQTIKTRISQAVAKISDATSVSDGSWILEPDSEIKIHLIFSICGGTGCGTFLNTAYIIRDVVPKCNLKAYAILPDIFKSIGGSMAFVGANAYGALSDLDYFMTMIDGKESSHLPYELQMYNTKLLDKRPFDAVFLIDNKNKNGDTYNKLDQIEKMIGLVLYSSAGELSRPIESQINNFEKQADDYRVKNKEAWITATGLCELMVSTETLKNIYSLKAASLLADKMLTAKKTSQDAENKVRTWIDSHAIRENEDNDQLLDSLFDLSSLKPYVNDISDESIKGVVSSWVSKKAPDTKETNEVKEKRLIEIKAAFDEVLSEILKEDGGVQFAKGFISKLLSEILEFKREMDEEKKELSDERARAEQAKDDAINRMLKGKGFLHRAKSFYPEIDSKVNDLVKKTADLVRHESAFQFFSAFAEYIQKKQENIQDLAVMLEAAKDNFGGDISAIENAKNKNPFQIDLTPRLVKNVDPSQDPDIKVSVFVDSISNPDGLLSFVGKKVEIIVNSLLSYCHALESNKKYDKVTIESLLQEIKDENEEVYRSIIKSALNKSDVLLQINPDGFNTLKPLSALYVAVKDSETTILETDAGIKSIIKSEAENVQFANIPSDKNIIFLRQVGVLPAYQIDSVMKYEQEYNDLSESGANFHIDLGLQRLMKQKKFQLMPSGSKEDDILEVWVKGFILGLIRHESSGSQYEIKSQMAGGLARNDFWFKLDAKGTEARADAYERFKTMTKVLKEDILPKIQEEERAKGYEKCREMYSELLNDRYLYLDKARYCLDLSTLGRPGYERTSELFEKEFAYLKEIVESFSK